MDVLTFANNLRYLRKLRGYTLAEMEASSGFKRSTWSGYEKGSSFPNFSELIKISEYFGVGETELLHVDLSNTHLNQKSTGKKKQVDTHLKAHLPTHPYALYFGSNTSSEGVNVGVNAEYGVSRMPSVITVNPGGDENILYVPVKAQAGYSVGLSDKEYMEKLPSFQMPGLRNGTFRMFEVQGISMSPTLSDRDRVIGEWVPSLSEIRENRVHIVVLKDGVVIKRVLNRIKERNKLYLKSDTLTHRQDYPIKEIDPEDVLEMWYVRLKVSGDLSEPSELYNRVSDLEINMLEVLKKLGKM